MLHPSSLRFVSAAACAALALLAGTASAQVYRSVGPDGKVIYSDKPPAANTREAAPAAFGPGPEPDALATFEGDALLAVAVGDFGYAPVERRVLFDEGQEAPERLEGRVELVGRVDDEPLAQQEQATEL